MSTSILTVPLAPDAAAMKRGRFYDPPFALKMALLLCLVLIGLAHRKGWMSRTVGKSMQEYSTTAPQRPYELKPAPVGK